MEQSLRERNKQIAMQVVRESAQQLMRERGFEGVTVEQIAAASNVSPSTVYRHFGTKEALVLSSDRPTQLVDRIAKDDSKRTSIEAFVRAASKVWDSDPASKFERSLIMSNQTLLEAWERQLLDQRSQMADAFADRRGAKSTGLKDRSTAAASLAILITVLRAQHERGDDAKPLPRQLDKAFAALGA